MGVLDVFLTWSKARNTFSAGEPHRSAPCDQRAARLRGLDSRTWSTATWSVPLTTQVLLALIIVASWLFGKWYPASAAIMQFGVGAAAVFVVCAVIAFVLARSATPRAQGVAVSIAGGYAVVLVGGLLYGFWILGW